MQRDDVRAKIALDHALFPQNLGVLNHHLDTLFAALDALGHHWPSSVGSRSHSGTGTSGLGFMRS